MMAIQFDDLLTIEESAAILKVTPHCIRKWFTQPPRGFPPLARVKVGKLTRIRRNVLEKYLSESEAA